MKKLAITIIIFLVPVIIGLGFIEVSLRKIPNDYSYKSTYVTKHSSDIEVLYLGSSHIFFGINPEFSQYKSFNLAMTSQDLDLDWKVFNNYKNWNNIKTIVIPIDYISLYSKLEYGVEDWRMKNYVLYYNIPSNKLEDHFEVFNGKFSDNTDRILKYYKSGKTAIDCNSLGFGTSYKINRNIDLKRNAKEAVKRHSISLNSDKGKTAYNDNTKAIEKFISYAKANNINILFVSSPVAKYYSILTNNKQLHSTFSFLEKQLKSNYNCYYLNLMNDPEFSDKHFYDADHLNDCGAKIFTMKIDEEIKKIPK
ncbi:fibrobacter succinogenes paralogous family [Chryseobacterium nakagawai]|uniref:Uncharacterized protein n=1 Tax=Chryseobacterium nakagawai TaxID=1241982 RepID=A0AAD1DTJ5_CHRNA|nr:hypothetical protein [Chryseobacterium nakagawai]AZA93034.1 hypothetical protein EG343_21740 [Chryseobacterium nakagawai]VEH19667.1 fibrobacter succinogenes paralogous family [Chryseobacterium nakagawai]